MRVRSPSRPPFRPARPSSLFALVMGAALACTPRPAEDADPPSGAGGPTIPEQGKSAPSTTPPAGPAGDIQPDQAQQEESGNDAQPEPAVPDDPGSGDPLSERETPKTRQPATAEGCEDGKYAVGDEWKDDCNTCTCNPDGQVVCTLMACLGSGG